MKKEYVKPVLEMTIIDSDTNFAKSGVNVVEGAAGWENVKSDTWGSWN